MKTPRPANVPAPQHPAPIVIPAVYKAALDERQDLLDRAFFYYFDSYEEPLSVRIAYLFLLLELAKVKV